MEPLQSGESPSNIPEIVAGAAKESPFSLIREKLFKTSDKGVRPEILVFKQYKGEPLRESSEAAQEVQQMISEGGDASIQLARYPTAKGEKAEMPEQAFKDWGRMGDFYIGEQKQITAVEDADEESKRRLVGVAYEMLKAEYGEDAAFLIARITHQVFAQGLLLALLSAPAVTKLTDNEIAAASEHSDAIHVDVRGDKLIITSQIVMGFYDYEALTRRDEKNPVGFVGTYREVTIPLSSIPKSEEWVKDGEGNVKLSKEIPGLTVKEMITPYCKTADNALNSLKLFA